MTPVVHVVGLGPGDANLMTAETLAVLERVPDRYLRTTRHPAADAVANARSFDDLYDTAETFDEVYLGIVDALVAAATEHGEIVYAVPGSPRVAERAVDMLVADGRVTTTVYAALSFVDLSWVALGVDPLAEGVRIVDGRRFSIEAAGERGPLLVAQCDQPSVLSDIKLSVDDPGDATITVVQRLGLPDESIETVAWNDLDRVVEPDHLTSVYIPRLGEPVAPAFARFDEMVKQLRVECPWDAEQTHDSLRRYLLEESYEVLEAIDDLDVDDGTGYDLLEEELGDLLYQIFFHAILATEAGQFTVADVATRIYDKLYGRHPHVYGDVAVEDSDDVVANWEQIKKAEKGRNSVMDGLPEALPALLYALNVQKKAARLGFGLDGVDAALADVDDELAELREDPVPHEVGDLLFAGVQVARQLDADPEMLLRDAAKRFRNRFQHMEAAAEADGSALTDRNDAELARMWSVAKAALG